ncbi:MAG TPA: oligosaccharide flippase family protein [Terriglobales bacterium]|nr:oligosaccharide flippase family protein [Terriglobales bacterium]
MSLSQTSAEMLEPTADGPAPPPRASSGPSVGHRTTAGFVWMMITTLLARIVGFTFQIALARILLPKDWGLIAIVTSINGFASVIAGLGVKEMLIQRQGSFQQNLNAGFWLSVIGATVVGAVSCAGVVLYAHFGGDEQLIPLVILSSLGLLVTAVQLVPTCELNIGLHFRQVAKYQIISTVSGGLCTIAMALVGLGAASYFAGALVGAGLAAVLNWRRSAVKIALRLDTAMWRSFFHDGITLVFINLAWAGWGIGDRLILSAYVDNAELGYYFVGFAFAMTSIQMLGTNIGAVLFPALGRFAEEPERQRIAFLRATEVIAVVSIPIGVGVAAVADPVFRLLYGERYLASVPIVQILALGIASLTVSSAAGSMMFAQGRFRTQLAYALASMSVVLLLVAIGAKLDGAIGCAIAVSVGHWITTLAGTRIAFKGLPHATRRMLNLFPRPVIAAAAAFIPAHFLGHCIPIGDFPLSNFARAQLILRAASTGLTFCVLYYLLMVLLSPAATGELMYRLLALCPSKIRRAIPRFFVPKSARHAL